MVIEILSLSCFALVLVTADNPHPGLQHCKKSKWLHTRNILAQSWINFNQGFFRYCCFQVYAIFRTSPWQPFRIAPLHKLKQFYSETIVIKLDQTHSCFLASEQYWTCKHSVGHCDLILLWIILIFIIFITKVPLMFHTKL